MVWILILAGAGGGILRGIVGYLKYQLSYKNVGFRWGYFGIVTLLSAVVGAMAAWAVAASGLRPILVRELNPAIAFIVGYAGGDIIENIYKIIFGKTSLYA